MNTAVHLINSVSFNGCIFLFCYCEVHVESFLVLLDCPESLSGGLWSVFQCTITVCGQTVTYFCESCFQFVLAYYLTIVFSIGQFPRLCLALIVVCCLLTKIGGRGGSLFLF